jgi:hypothetical protein
MRALAELAMLVTEVPWRLSRTHHERARGTGLADDDIVHAVGLAAYFGHLNRIADAIGQPLDYEVRHHPPPAEPATPRLEVAPAAVSVQPALALSSRPTTEAALAAWRAYVMERDGALPRETRQAIARWVAALLGDGSTQPAIAVAHMDAEIRSVVETVTLAPWQLAPSTFAGARDNGIDDRGLFDIVVVASTAGVGSRIAVALSALSR